MKLIECVPNFSEGRDKSIINDIANIISNTEGVNLLDVDPGHDTNRTVVTFIGNPESVVDAAFNSIKRASELIDMSKHKGEHARMGATDVCPLIPIKNVTIEECVKYSKKLAELVGKELHIPVFLYEESSNKAYRKNLADIRKGEYEGMFEKIKNVKWKPDFGPSKVNKKSGTTAIGVRNFLIAYNVNLNTKEKKIATDIALDIREAGRAKRDSKGKFVRDKHGVVQKKPGTLKYTKAVGWYIDEYKKAQVSINITNHLETPLHIVFEEVREQSRKRGLRVTGSEIVGLLPKKSLFDAGIYYLKKQNLSTGIPEDDILHIAIESMGLNEISPFDVNKSIIENRINDKNNKLINMEVRRFVDEVSINSPAPGGGSVSALAGALSSSLISMVTNLSFGKKGYIENNSKFEAIGVEAQSLKSDFLELIDLDTDAFNGIMKAFRLPKKNEEDIKRRNSKIQDATINAIEVPLSMMKLSQDCIKLSNIIAKIGNKNSISDAGVALEMSISAFNGAKMNVLINLKDVIDNKYRKSTLKTIDTLTRTMEKEIKKGRDFLSKIL